MRLSSLLYSCPAPEDLVNISRSRAGEVFFVPASLLERGSLVDADLPRKRVWLGQEMAICQNFAHLSFSKLQLLKFARIVG